MQLAWLGWDKGFPAEGLRWVTGFADGGIEFARKRAMKEGADATSVEAPS